MRGLNGNPSNQGRTVMPLVVNLIDVAEAAEMPVTALLSSLRLPVADTQPRPLSPIHRGSCWCCGDTDVSDFTYDVCLNPHCRKPGMEWD